MNLELAMYFLSGTLFIVCCLVGVIWSGNNKKLDEHSKQIESKAAQERLAELENRMSVGMKEAEERWERLFDKQDAKHVREAESIRNDFREQLIQIREQINKTEHTILSQMNLLFKANNGN